MSATQEIMQTIESCIKVTPAKRNILKRKLNRFFKLYTEFYQLTPAERALLKQIYADGKKGHLREESANRLGISIKTLQGQITHLNKKLGESQVQKTVNKFSPFLS